MRLTSLLIFSTIAGGVPAGAQRPYQAPVTKPGNVSATVGTSGSNFDRVFEVIPTARNVPAFTWGWLAGMEKKPIGR